MGGILTLQEKERNVAASPGVPGPRSGALARKQQPPQAGQPPVAVVFVNLRLPPRPREGKAATLI